MMIVVKRKMRRTRIGLLSALALLGGVVGAAAAGPWRAGEGNTRGWQLMSPQERIEHQARVRGFTDYETCQAYRSRHHDLMVQRAQQRGLVLPGSHWDFCDRLKSMPSSPPASE
ncbi:hypothetical protein [Rhodopseudomonas palustris]